MAKNKILITGSNGFLGEEVVNFFARDNIIIALDKDPSINFCPFGAHRRVFGSKKRDNLYSKSCFFAHVRFKSTKTERKRY